jgi:hypothetical protein
MKSSLLILGFALLLISCSTHRNSVGHTEKNSLIVDSKDEIKGRWNQLLINNNLRGKISELAIRQPSRPSTKNTTTIYWASPLTIQ